MVVTVVCSRRLSAKSDLSPYGGHRGLHGKSGTLPTEPIQVVQLLDAKLSLLHIIMLQIYNFEYFNLSRYLESKQLGT
jgi:hypothetical protein